MMTAAPDLTCFRIEPRPNGVLHLVFDLPGRPMNVFTNAAIHELGRFAAWLKTSDARGVVVHSGKPHFCAGADLTELAQAYAMIMAAPKPERSRVAFDHFIPLSRALRALETSGKPVAAAISGLALGGGYELALGCHHRIVANTPKGGLGLPESLVGLLPGAGGTQRLPRLIGVEAALPVLLDGARLSPRQALDLGAADAVVAPGEEVPAAEAWVLNHPETRQPWDRSGFSVDPRADELVDDARRRVLERTNGRYPAPVAILDCLEQGLGQSMDAALEREMTIFSGLIQRPEARNMIRTLFIARTEYERLRVAEGLPALVAACVAAISRAWSEGGTSPAPAPLAWPASWPPDGEENAGYWFEREELSEPQGSELRRILAAALAVSDRMAEFGDVQQRLVDYAAVSELGFPAHLGGPFALLRYLGPHRFAALHRRAGA